MLLSLQIRNFALMEKVTLSPGAGLNILSGETGSGKSIVVQALEILMGGRSSSELIRQGEEEAEVVGLFQRGEEELSLRRVISRTGKNRAYWNERPVPVATLVEVGQGLVDLAGQHEHQVLLQAERHLGLLDEFGCQEEVATYREKFRNYRELLTQKDRLEKKAREARAQEDFFRFQVKELEAAALREGEEEELQREKEISKHAVRLKELGLRGEELLETGEEAVTVRLARLLKDLQSGLAVDPSLKEFSETVESSLCHLQEVSRKLGSYAEAIACDPERLQEIEDRLALISRLKKKYGGSIASLLQTEQEMRRQLGLLTNFDEESAKIDRQLEKEGPAVVAAASSLKSLRGKAAQRLSRLIEGELKELGMPAAQFAFDLRPLGALNQGVSIGSQFYGENGSEEGEFLIAPNPGEGMRSLTRIASGGEISRVFLAIKKVLGLAKAVDTCVFDEVDVGIGGRVADVVGRNLSQLATEKQVLCVTHLPQIACHADQHFVIQKRVVKGRTQTVVGRVESARRETEIARMLAGVKITDQAMAHAREMMREALRR